MHKNKYVIIYCRVTKSIQIDNQPDEHMTPASWAWEHVVEPITMLLYAQEKRDDSVPEQARPVSRISPAP